jgi:hypothetical protein
MKTNFWKDWKTWVAIVLLLTVLSLSNSNKDKDRFIEFQKRCIDDCISEFELCLDDVTSYNLEHGIKTTPQDPKILSCLWKEEGCVEISCQIYHYELWKASGRPE